MVSSTLGRGSGRGWLTYAYALNLLGADSALALATYQGYGDPGASANLADGPYPLVLSPGFAIRSWSYGWMAEHRVVRICGCLAQHREALDPSGLWQSAIERPQDILRLLAYLDAEVKSAASSPG